MKSKLKTYKMGHYIKKSCLYYLTMHLNSYHLYDSTYTFLSNREVVEIQYNYLKHIKVQIEIENELEEVFEPTETVSGALTFPVFIFKLIVDKKDAETLQHVVNCAKDKISWSGSGDDGDKSYIFSRIPADDHVGDNYTSIQKIVMDFEFEKLKELYK